MVKGLELGGSRIAWIYIWGRGVEMTEINICRKSKERDENKD